MDRPVIFSLEQIRLFDQAWGWRYMMIGIGLLAQAFLGKIDTVVTGFAATQTTSPSLTINLGEGQIYKYTDVDSTQWGGLPADLSDIMQQGQIAAQQKVIPNTTGSGQSQWVLIEATFAQDDVIAANDPNNGVLPYVNVQNPSQPLNGPAGSGIPQDTERKAIAVVTVKPGVAATTGTAVPPNPDSGYVPMYLILLTFGQTTITTGQILKAGNSAYAGYQEAPFFPGVTGTIPGGSGSHHGGIAGQANQIQLDSEVEGILPFPNLPVSNASPPTVTGIVVVAGDIPILSQSNANPNAALAGIVNDLCFDKVHNIMYVCTTSGTSGTAVWAAVGNPGTVIETSITPLVPVPGFIYLIDTSGGDKVVNLPLSVNCSTLPVTLVNANGPNAITINPQTGENINGGANGTAGAMRLVTASEGVKLAPKASGGFWTAP